MQLYGVFLLTAFSLPIMATHATNYYYYDRGNVYINLPEKVLTSSFECFFATFSPVANTSWLPLFDLGLACNETDVITRLADKTAPQGFIALAIRGSCVFTDKTSLAVRNNAKGLIVYNEDETDYPFIMGTKSDYKSSIPVVSVSGNSGRAILSNTSEGVMATIDSSGGGKKEHDYQYNEISITIFIILTSVVLVVVLLALLLTIYQLWCRCFVLWKRRRREREESRLVKKKLQEIHCNRYAVGETTSVDGIHDSCSVCLEDFQVGDMIRTLPCTHPFHQACVDKWLYKKHKCPLCKFDIIKGEYETCSENDIPQVIETRRPDQPEETATSIQTDSTSISNSSEEFLIPPASRENVQQV